MTTCCVMLYVPWIEWNVVDAQQLGQLCYAAGIVLQAVGDIPLG